MGLVSRLFGKKSAATAEAPAAAAAETAALLADAKEHFRVGRMELARQCYERVVNIDPSHAQALYMLGGISLNEGATEKAIAFVRRAIGAAPQNADFHFSLGSVLVAAERSADAIPYFQEAVRLRPDFPEWRRHLGAALHKVGRHDEAIASAITTDGTSAKSAESYFELGTTFHQLGRLKEAEAAFQEAARLAPEVSAPLVSIAAVQLDQGRPVEAEAAARRALKIGPNSADTWFTLGSVLSSQARHVEAVEHLMKAVELQPDLAVGWNLLLFSLNYSDHWSAREIYEAHVRWGRRFASATPMSIEASHRVAGHRLRIGYLSGDYRQHPIAFFIEGLLKHHDRSKFEIFCYHSDGRIDQTTQRLKATADHWRWMVAASEPALEQAIRDDKIDILVELSGHTEGHQLGVLARRVAPIQVTYLGYPNSTGLPAIDYRFTDELADPPGMADSLHVENLIRLPGTFLCYTPPEGAMEPSVPPNQRNGFITFGSFNNFAKLSPTVLQLWAEILTSVPGSKLMIKTRGLEDPGLRTLLRDRLESNGVARDRVLIVDPTAGHREHMGAYTDVDIALDTFPYHGTTTTLDALWMGVPVITLVGDRHASRVGLSILSCVGLAELATCSSREYVEAAVRLASDLSGLEQIRRTLRAKVIASPLTDGKGFATRVEQAYLRIWAETLARD